MDENYYNRQVLKDPESAVIFEISKGFNLTPILAQAYFKEIRGLFEQHFQAPKMTGAIMFEAIRMEDPPGRRALWLRPTPVLSKDCMGGRPRKPPSIFLK